MSKCRGRAWGRRCRASEPGDCVVGLLSVVDERDDLESSRCSWTRYQARRGTRQRASGEHSRPGLPAGAGARRCGRRPDPVPSRSDGPVGGPRRDTSRARAPCHPRQLRERGLSTSTAVTLVRALTDLLRPRRPRGSLLHRTRAPRPEPRLPATQGGRMVDAVPDLADQLEALTDREARRLLH